MTKHLSSSVTRYAAYVLIVLSVIWTCIYLINPHLLPNWILLGQSNFLGAWSNSACILAGSTWLARKLYLQSQHTEQEKLFMMRRWLLYLRKHHILFGWVTLITATVHGLYFVSVVENDSVHAITGWIAWGLLLFLVVMGVILNTRRMKRIRIYHVGLAALFLVVATLHSFVLFGGLVLWTVVWILMNKRNKPKSTESMNWEDAAMENKKLYAFGKPNVFGLPKGLLGSLAGWLMGRLSGELNTWAVHHLDVQPTDHVLEIGFGPGLGIAYLSELSTEGLTAGMDPSPEMMRQATKRNALAIQSGRVELREGSMPRIPYDDKKFDKVLSVNNIMLWPQPEASLHEVRRVLKPGGRIAITLCPRWAKTFQDVEDMAHEITDLVNRTGFTMTTVDLRNDLKPAGALTVVAYSQ